MGGVPQIHHYLTDSNVDWAQQLNQVRHWQQRHPTEECWFTYFAGAFLPPESYGVTCHALPNGAQIFFRMPPNKDTPPPIIHGAVLVSASEAAGSIYVSSKVNPYARFQSTTPDEIIDGGVLIFRGDIPMQEAASASRVLEVWNLLSQHQPALARAEEAAQIAPDYIYGQWALGDAAAAAGNKDEARTAYQKALAQAAQVEPERRSALTAPIQAALSKL